MPRSDGSYASNENVKIGGDTVRITVSVQEGPMFDEVRVRGSVWDEFLGPGIAEKGFTLWP